MSDRKSSRARKTVDYAHFGGDEDDDDFRDCTPPVPKRAKLSNKENKEKKKSEQKKENKSKQSRKSLEERLYEKELQEALQLSLSQSDGSQESSSTPIDSNTNAGDQPPVLIKIDDEERAPSPILPHLEAVSVPKSSSNKADDDIEVIETNIDVIPSSSVRGGRSNKTKKYIDSDSEPDSDFNPADADDSFEDDGDDSNDDDYNDEDSDSDFGSSKKKKSSKKENPKAKPSAVKKSSTSKKTEKPKEVNKKPSSKSTVSTVKSSSVNGNIGKNNKTSTVTSCRTPTSSSVTRKPLQWKPPGASGDGKSPVVTNTKPRLPVNSSVKMSPLGGVNVKSPNSGLRLGLSRNMKLKPLHPNLKTGS
ncbi:hypothetical protein ACF0H5_015513 [Mactra antiquata]